ncbi:mortality factor 4-like protein 1 [Folsomia candida]|uniref:mortality factor 4-like protein 1 n=1 Tax=Folsomia candida TaxID=158441 RepID=UPI000B9073D3|nr:mortality factor 4-like protein 1 [Folsomia candida]
MSDSDPPPPPFFENNERVLCFHGPLVYEGKTLKTEYRQPIKEYAYLIHYAGWNKSWDEWVLESRVLKYTDSNLVRQKELKLAHEEQLRNNRKSLVVKTPVNKKRSNVGSDTASVISASDSRSSTPIMDQKVAKTGKRDSIKNSDVGGEEFAKKRNRSECVEQESIFQVKQEVQIVLPHQLRTFLVDDWDNVVRQRRLVKLPARHSVEQILENYLKTRKKTDMHAVELCNGLREYFNCMIGSQLLYRYEREQFLEIWKTYQGPAAKKQMSEIYGISHLMRLFTKLGVCLSYTSLDVEAVNLLQQCVEEFLTFLVKNYEDYFSLEDYGVSDPEYQRQVPV